MVRKRFNAFDIFVYLFMSLVAVVMLYPFVNIASVSMSSLGSTLRNPLMIFPQELNFSAYKVLLGSPLLLQCYQNTIIITVVGTALSMALTITLAYPLSRQQFLLRPAIVYLIVGTMMFNGGLIPNFHLVRSLGLYDTMGALILPGSLSAFNVILLINFFKSIPESLLDAAKIDGASERQILMRIMLPLSMAILATLALFYAVGRWNSFFNAVIYIRDRDKWTLQLLLREVLLSITSPLRNPNENYNVPPQSMQYATIMATVLPILVIYPFLQRYFIKGVMLGSVKG